MRVPAARPASNLRLRRVRSYTTKLFDAADCRQRQCTGNHPAERVQERTAQRAQRTTQAGPMPHPLGGVLDILENEGKIKKGSIAVKDVYTNEFNPFARGHA